MIWVEGRKKVTFHYLWVKNMLYVAYIILVLPINLNLEYFCYKFIAGVLYVYTFAASWMRTKFLLEKMKKV